MIITIKPHQLFYGCGQYGQESNQYTPQKYSFDYPKKGNNVIRNTVTYIHLTFFLSNGQQQ